MIAGTGTAQYRHVDTAKFYWCPVAGTLTAKIPVPLPGREPQPKALMFTVFNFGSYIVS